MPFYRLFVHSGLINVRTVRYRYQKTVSLTTVGYGDIYPVTTTGRTIAMISSMFGIAIVALPAGIITAGYMEVINERHNKDNNE